jgi:hypothetical protein
VPLRDYLSPGNLVRLIGVRGLAKIIRGRFAGRRTEPAPAT